jgi:hypothetical protein
VSKERKGKGMKKLGLVILLGACFTLSGCGEAGLQDDTDWTRIEDVTVAADEAGAAIVGSVNNNKTRPVTLTVVVEFKDSQGIVKDVGSTFLKVGGRSKEAFYVQSPASGVTKVSHEIRNCTVQ